MCARTTISRPLEDLMIAFKTDLTEGEFRLPRYNAAPTQSLPVVYSRQGRSILAPFRWGLVPSWAKDLSIGTKMINARAETLHEKVSFKRLLKDRRCLVVADGFYEWMPKGKDKVPVRITLKSNELFAFAGLWDTWTNPMGQEIRSYTIITTSSESDDIMKNIHDRMPVILDRDNEKQWLDSSVAYDKVLSQNPPSTLEAYEVSKVVNSPGNDLMECIARS